MKSKQKIQKTKGSTTQMTWSGKSPLSMAFELRPGLREKAMESSGGSTFQAARTCTKNLRQERPWHLQGKEIKCGHSEVREWVGKVRGKSCKALPRSLDLF